MTPVPVSYRYYSYGDKRLDKAILWGFENEGRNVVGILQRLDATHLFTAPLHDIIMPEARP
jgi:hypothetical protein